MLKSVEQKLAQIPKLIHRPYCIQFDLVRGCNFTCDFCPMDKLPEKKEFMSFDLVKKTAIEISKLPPTKILFSPRGETFLNKRFGLAIKLIKKYNPKHLYTVITNGSLVTRERAQEFFDSGGNLMIVDVYKEKFYELYKKRFEGICNITDYYEDKSFNPFHQYHPKTKHICLMKDFGVGKYNEKMTRMILNKGGSLTNEKWVKPNPNLPYEKKCAYVFRNLFIYQNGNIVACCNDWVEESVFANINDDGFDMYDFWYNNKWLNIFRLLLYNKVRNFAMCKKCDYNGGFRLGFLPKLPILKANEKDYLLKYMQDNEHKLVNKKLIKEKRLEGK